MLILGDKIGAQKLVSQQIEAETSKAAAEMFPVALTAKQVLAIPSQGRSNADILSEMKSYQKFDANGHDGKTFAYSIIIQRSLVSSFIDDCMA